jgi:hypothetical protein
MPKYFPVHGEISGLGQLVPRLPAVVGHRSISNTTFHNNSTGRPKAPDRRLTVRDVAIYRCEHFACLAYGAVFEDITITDLRGGGKAPSFLWGCVYSHVRLRGWIAGLMWRWRIDPNDEAASRRFLAANTAMYAATDWALDISEAKFSFCESLLGVPAHLVRRNDRIHFVMNREGASRLLEVPAPRNVWRITAEDLIDSGLPDTVIVTGGSGEVVRAQLAEAKVLLDKGSLV